MAIVADSGAIYALYDAADRHHRQVVAALKKHSGPVVVPAPVLGELDYLLRHFLGVDAELSFLDDVRSGAYTIESTQAADIARCRELIETYRDLNLGLADASVVAIAERLGVRRVLTVDQRHFRAVRPRGGPFTLLPADSA
jgi:predicted nucleic acid-binding protein